ncbi:MAG: outer membrane beta-barrel protein [Candidatus Korobacteraceae bacterium]
MNSRHIFLSALASLLVLVSTSAFAQTFEVTAHLGGQINGGLDLSTTQFDRIEVKNALNYGATVGALLGEHYGVEFQWNRTSADTLAQPLLGGPDTRIFNLSQNQYMGNFVYHFTGREMPLRPFAYFGMGASDLSPGRGVDGTTQFAVAVGAGAKYNFSKHFGLRGQVKWSPTYITTTDAGYWCDPFWGGCWVVGNDKYFHEFDMTGGITFRF